MFFWKQDRKQLESYKKILGEFERDFYDVRERIRGLANGLIDAQQDIDGIIRYLEIKKEPICSQHTFNFVKKKT